MYRKRLNPKLNHILVILMCCVLFSCRTSDKVVYFQNAGGVTNENAPVFAGIVIQPKDVLSIIISSKDPQLAMGLNLPMQSYQAGSDERSSSYTQRLLGYLVDMEGNIDFPSLGKLKVSGMTREQLAAKIQQDLREEILNDAIVNVEFMNFRISVLGEVSRPGTYESPNDKITILEALGRAGDLTIYGKREDVLVLREQNWVHQYIRVDLLSAKIYESPAFYLQQNDVVYVSPNTTMSARSQINENKMLSIWISMASVLTSLAFIIFR